MYSSDPPGEPVFFEPPPLGPAWNPEQLFGKGFCHRRHLGQQTDVSSQLQLTRTDDSAICSLELTAQGLTEYFLCTCCPEYTGPAAPALAADMSGLTGLTEYILCTYCPEFTGSAAPALAADMSGPTGSTTFLPAPLAPSGTSGTFWHLLAPPGTSF